MICFCSYLLCTSVVLGLSASLEDKKTIYGKGVDIQWVNDIITFHIRVVCV